MNNDSFITLTVNKNEIESIEYQIPILKGFDSEYIKIYSKLYRITSNFDDKKDKFMVGTLYHPKLNDDSGYFIVKIEDRNEHRKIVISEDDNIFMLSNEYIAMKKDCEKTVIFFVSNTENRDELIIELYNNNGILNINKLQS